MTLDEGLFTVIHNDATIAAAVVRRIYPDAVPRTPTYPLIVYRRTGYDGPAHSTGATDKAKYSYQIDVHAKAKVDRDTIANRLRAVLHGEKRFLTDLRIGAILLQDEERDYEPAEDGPEPGIYWASQDYLIIADANK